MKKTLQSQVPIISTIILGAFLIIFTQAIKLLKNPESTPITKETFYGVAVLALFAYLGIVFSNLMKKTGISILVSFPVLGWVSIISLIFCLFSNFFVKAIGGVDFLSITTPVLAFAGISVADNLKDVSKNSWKYLIVAVFVFLGSYLFRVILAQLGLMISN